MVNPMGVASPDPRSERIFRILHQKSETQTAKNKNAYSSTFFHEYCCLQECDVTVFYKCTDILEDPEDVSSRFLQDVSNYLSGYIEDSIFTVISKPATFFYILCKPNGKSTKYTT
jgi:hypothetical protein